MAAKDPVTGHRADYDDTLDGKTLTGFIRARQIMEGQK